MKQLLITSLLALFIFSNFYSQVNSYKNPILPGFYPDPSVCRVGEDYYLVTSSFQFFPGVPVFHSKDLIHWKQIGHCLTRQSQLPLEKARSSGGIYAPTIRYNNGTFYMVTTNVSGGGNFFVTSNNPAGEWSEPTWIKQGGIDPTIFFDDDGKTYFMSTGYSKDKIGIDFSEIDLKTGKILSEIKNVWSGTGGRYPEAPHIYKVNGWYYLMVAEGGTEFGHMETISRSKNIWGPYESNPDNPILTHRNISGMITQIQGTGHADLVQAHDGSWWTVFLGFRTAGGSYHHLGRETFLMPVQWNKEGWPFINEQDTASLLVTTKTLPLQSTPSQAIRDEFDNKTLDLKWNFLRNPNAATWSLMEKPGCLRLKGTEVSLNDVNSPAFIGRRQQHFNFRTAASLNFDTKTNGEEAGLTLFMDEQHRYDLYLTYESGKKYVVLRYRIGSIVHEQAKVAVENPNIILSVNGTAENYTFSYQLNNLLPRIEIGKVETRYLSSEVAGGFTGVYIGLYSTGNGKMSNVPADFDWFEYEGKE